MALEGAPNDTTGPPNRTVDVGRNHIPCGSTMSDSMHCIIKKCTNLISVSDFHLPHLGDGCPFLRVSFVADPLMASILFGWIADGLLLQWRKF